MRMCVDEVKVWFAACIETVAGLPSNVVVGWFVVIFDPRVRSVVLLFWRYWLRNRCWLAGSIPWLWMSSGLSPVVLGCVYVMVGYEYDIFDVFSF
jgi:hypothetical protein